MMTQEQMVNDIISRRGMEDEISLEFSRNFENGIDIEDDYYNLLDEMEDEFLENEVNENVLQSADEMWDYLVEMGIATEDFIRGAVMIGGHNIETMEAVLFYHTGWQNFKGFIEELEG